MKKFSSLAAIAALMLTVGCSSEVPDARGAETSTEHTLENMEPITLTFSDGLPENSASGRAMTAFMDKVREETGGKVDFDTYWSGALHSQSEQMTAITTGLTDITNMIPSRSPEELPLGEWANMVGTARFGSYPENMVAGSIATLELMMDTPEFVEELESHNGKLITLGPVPAFGLMCTEPIATPEQARGKVAATTGWPYSEDLEALGFSTASLETTEWYEALQRGVIDCLALVGSSFTSSSIWDVAKYWIPIESQSPTGSGYQINLDVWNELPTEVQQIFSEAAADYNVTYLQEQAKSAAEFVAGLDEHGVETVDVSELAEVIAETHEDRISGTVDEYAPANVSDPGEVVSRYQATMEEWSSIIHEDFGFDPVDNSDSEALAERYTEVYESFPWEDFDEASRPYVASLFE